MSLRIPRFLLSIALRIVSRFVRNRNPLLNSLVLGRGSEKFLGFFFEERDRETLDWEETSPFFIEVVKEGLSFVSIFGFCWALYIVADGF